MIVNVDGAVVVGLRRAIVATALASILYGLFWAATTQLPEIRAVSPFGEDPYDLVASVAIILLPLVGVLTAIRVARYGPSAIPAGPVASRIRLGLGICLGLVSGAMVAVWIALVVEPMAGEPSDVAILAGAAVVTVATIAAWAALAVSRSQAVDAGPSHADEPDAFDDLVAILPIPSGLRIRLAELADHLRRHRALAGLVASLAAAIAAVTWHAIRDGAWANPTAAMVYGGLLATVLLTAYGLLIGPLRVLRPA